MKLLVSKSNEKNFFLRSQLCTRAYVRIWTLRPCHHKSLTANTICSEATRHGIVTSPSRIPAGLGKLVRLADLEGGVHEAFFLFLLTTQMHFAIISGQHWMINAWIMEILIKNASIMWKYEIISQQIKWEKFFSQISAVHTGVRAYMDATPLSSQIVVLPYFRSWEIKSNS